MTALDPTGANVQTTTNQTLDIYGNVTQASTVDYGNASTRTYTNAFLSGSNYTPRYIFNRLQSSTVANASQSVQMVWNNYDLYGTYQCTGYYPSLTDTSGIREHDSNYGTSFNYRGNVTSSIVLGVTTCASQYITGDPVTVIDTTGYSVGITQTSTTNYAAPGVITPNSTTNLQNTFSYTGGLDVGSIVGPNSATASTTYFAKSWPQQVTSVNGAVTNYSYSSGTPFVITATTNSHWVQTTVDGFGRPTGVVRGNGSTTVSTVNTVYGPCACSPLGKMTQVSQPYTPGATPVWTTYTYDGLGRTVKVVSPDGASSTTYAYAGNTTTITDPAGKWKKQTVDAFGNLTQVNEPNPAGGADYVTTYTYDVLNHLKQVSMPRPTGTQTHAFVYDPTTQRLSSETHPEMGTTSYTYNTDGTVATKTDAKGQKTQFVYDTFKRVTQLQSFPDPAHPTVEDTCQRVTNTYDTNGLDSSFTQDGWGRLTTSQWGGTGCVTPLNGSLFTQMYSYTVGGLVTKKRLGITRSTWSQNLDALYNYDNEGRMTSMTYPTAYVGNNPPALQSGPTFTYALDAMERPITMSSNQVTWKIAERVAYNAADQITQMDRAKGGGLEYTETRQYNALLQMTSLAANQGQYSYTYTYSGTQNNGRMVQSVDSVAGQTVNYTYDTLNRLSAATGTGWSDNYVYDGFGNLLDKNQTGTGPRLSVTVNSANNQINSGGYTYDPSGNMTVMPGITSMTYDVRNRIASATLSSGTEKYSYSPDNNRVWRLTATGSEELHFYGAFGERLGTYGIANIQGYKVFQAPINGYFAGMIIWTQTTGSDGTVSGGMVAQDKLGSVGKYYPYGEDTSTPVLGDNYATYYRDGTGLDYARNRYYLNTIGRFLTADPYRASRRSANNPADPGTWNRYAYLLNDPVNLYDPSGMDSESPPTLVCNGYTGVICDLLYDPYGGGHDAQHAPGGGMPPRLPRRIIVSRLSTTSKQALTVQNDLRWLQQAIAQDPDCAGWLAGSSQAINYMLDVPGTGATMMAVGVGSFSTNDNAVDGISGTNLPQGMLITVNSNGAFFNSGPSQFVGYGIPSWINGGTNAAQSEILLHELAHDVGAPGFQSDGPLPDGSPNVSAQTANNQLVMQNCGNVVDLAAGRH